VQGNMNPLIIGLLLSAILASFSLNTGSALNPVRDFGPRLWIAIVSGGESFNNTYWWIPIVATSLGGVVGALIYDFTIAKVLIARGLPASGNTETHGAAVRVPDRHAETTESSVR
jgi:glycerol uptake facilitator protein